MTFVVGFGMIGGGLFLDRSLVPSILLEVGAAIGLVGVLFLVERTFLRAVKADNEATLETVSDIVESGALPNESGEFKIEVVATSIERGREPKILIRITDPEGDYKTTWLVKLTSPSGETREAKASWPGSGNVFRARFPVEESRAGTWRGIATRNGSKDFDFSGKVDG